MDSILVSGGAGYIGSHLCKALAKGGYHPVTFDNLSSGHRSSLRWGDFCLGDLSDEATVQSVFAQYEFSAVIHLAGRSSVEESVREPLRYHRDNVIGTINVVEAMRRHGVRHLIFSSTAAVYGDPQYTPIDEDHPTVPTHPYGITKLAAEEALSKRGDSAVRSVCLRYFNAAGASPDGDIGELHDPETHLIPNVLRAAITGEPVTIHGTDYPTPDGTCIRDFIHVDDLCEAHLQALDYLREGGRSTVFNLGSDRGYSVIDIIARAQAVVDKVIERQSAPRRVGDPAVLVAASAKARDALHWAPRRSDIETILSTAWRWHQARHTHPPRVT